MNFGEYDPDAHGTPLTDAVVRPIDDADAGRCAELLALRDGGCAAEHERRLDFWRQTGQPIFVAEFQGRVIGGARLTWLTPTADGGHGAPDGWYLNGMGVDSEFRRRGLGRALTRARCDWAWARGEVVYFVVNSSNRASMDLHRELGFRELTRDFAMPGVTFTDGEGVLFAADESSLARQVTQLRVGAAR